MDPAKLVTAEEFWLMGEENNGYELIRRELQRIPWPNNGLHGTAAAQIGSPIWLYNKQHDLGTAYMGDVGCILERDPDTVLGPDIAFVRSGRLPPDDDGDGFLPIAPDLAVEIDSPWHQPGYVANKIKLYLATGVPLVWLIDPGRRTVAVHAANGTVRVLGEGDELDGGEVLPGFRLPVADIFR